MHLDIYTTTTISGVYMGFCDQDQESNPISIWLSDTRRNLSPKDWLKVIVPHYKNVRYDKDSNTFTIQVSLSSPLENPSALLGNVVMRILRSYQRYTFLWDEYCNFCGNGHLAFEKGQFKDTNPLSIGIMPPKGDLEIAEWEEILSTVFNFVELSDAEQGHFTALIILTNEVKDPYNLLKSLASKIETAYTRHVAPDDVKHLV